MDAADDDGLMAQVRSGDRAAFECLVHRHLDSVHRYLVRLTPSPADADELAQECAMPKLAARRFKKALLELGAPVHP